MGIKSLFQSFFLLFTISVVGQTFYPIITIERKDYHEIEVVAGMTFYGLLKQTGISESIFLKHNPGIDKELIIGKKILLPADRKNIQHIVAPKESLYGIAKQYVVALDSLYNWNKGIQANGIKIGQQISVKQGIPRIKMVVLSESQTVSFSSNDDSVQKVTRAFNFEDTILNYKVQEGDKLYDLSKRFMVSVDELKLLNNLKSSSIKGGSVLKIPIVEKNDIELTINEIPQKKHIAIPKTKIEKKIEMIPLDINPKQFDPINIAVFLPLNLDSITYPIRGSQRSAFDFYMGAKMAIDSLEAKGLKGKVVFYDYRSKDESPTVLIQKNKLIGVDLIIAPWQKKECEVLSSFSEKNEIKLVLPILVNSEVISSNENAFLVPTEEEPQLLILANKLAELSKSHQIYFIQSDLEGDKLREEKFKNFFYTESEPNTRLIDVNSKNFEVFAKSTQPCIFICVSLDKVLIQSIGKSLSTKKNAYLFGLREWSDWKEINSTLNQKMDYYYYSTTCFSYHNQAVKDFHKKYRVFYGADLSKAACLGFDVLYRFPLWSYGVENLQPGLMTDFEYGKTVAVNHSNYGLMLVRFNEFESKKVFDVEWE